MNVFSHWSLLRLVVVTGSCLGLALGGISTAFADEVGPSDPPPPVYADGQLCSLYSIGIFNTSLDIPEHVEEGAGPTATGPLRGNGIHGAGRITVNNNTSCSHAQVKFQLESNFCNRLGWNCNWKPIADNDWQLLPVSGALTAELLGDCRSGTDSYRMTAIVSHVEMSFEETPTGGFVPYLETKSQDFHSDEIKIDCG